MKKIWEFLFFAFFIFCMFLFKPRQDLVFAAIEESQYIRLFEEGNDFVLCVDENKIFRGTYSISSDTVFLVYEEPRNFNRLPPGKLYIHKNSSSIKSTDGESFSAEIYMDLREKSTGTQTRDEWDLTDRLTLKRANLSLSGTGKEAWSN